MALQKITKDGYGQLELNLVAFPRDGRIVAQTLSPHINRELGIMSKFKTRGI